MKHKFAALTFAAFLFAVGISKGYGQEQPLRSAADRQKIEALDDAYKNGVLTQQEYDAKLRELNAGAGAPNAGGAIDTRIVGIFDPILQLNFLTMPIPSDWVFQGGLVQGSSCGGFVSNFYRATSPDGLSGSKELPRLDWAWSDNAPYDPGPRSDCLPYNRPIAAADFLQYMVSLLHVEYVKDFMTEAELENARRPRNSGGILATEDVARALTRFKINSIQEEELMYVHIICNYKAYLPPMRGVPNHVCSAYVNLTWAPEGKLVATYRMVQSTMAWRFNPAWLQRRAQLTAQQTANMVGQIIANGQAFRQGMDMRFQQHQELMATMQQGYDRSNQRAIEGMNAQQHMSDDWCDYALGVQKRYDPTTGQLSKTNSAYTYDWVNAEGKHLQYNDINSNPNGLGNGNWTLTTNVH